MYALHMLKERLQILITRDQRRKLEAEASRRRVSVAHLIREAIDLRFNSTTAEEREEALRAIIALNGAMLSAEELNQIVEQAYTDPAHTDPARR